MKKITITLDTNTIIDLEKDPDLQSLYQLYKEGEIKIVKTDVVDTELPEDFAKRKSKEFSEDMGSGYYDNSRYGHCTYGKDPNFEDILKIVFPETVGPNATKTQNRDSMHLATHTKYERDCFVTKDKGILRKKEELKKAYGINIKNPKECIDELKSKL